MSNLPPIPAENLTPEQTKEFEALGYLFVCNIPGRGICGIMKFMFTVAIVYGLDDSGYRGRWCFPDFASALTNFALWAQANGTGDPPGPWIKYKGYGGERSNPNL